MSPARTPKPRKADLVIVANRLPVDRVVNDDGSVAWRRSPGGLVTAIEPVMRENDGAWIGWSGSSVAVCETRVVPMLPVAVQVPVAGS